MRRSAADSAMWQACCAGDVIQVEEAIAEGANIDYVHEEEVKMFLFELFDSFLDCFS